MTKETPQHRPARPRFRDTALAAGLVDESQLAAAEREIVLVLDRRTADPEAWDRAISERLVTQGLLTPFQAREILAGRRRFRLGQYTVLDEIAKGGMGQVFRAEHAMMGREVAVKVLPRAKSTPESEAAFRREMRMLGRLDHENLVRAYDAGYDAMVSYLVTELVPGMDLKRHVQTHGTLSETAAASVITQAARGLAYAHAQGLVHRDVKPGNLIVMQDGRVKVLDLGLAGSQLEEESSRVGRVVGTMDYIAPEQIRSPDDVGPSADIYALGCTLYYAVTGRVPFPGGSRKEKMQRHLTETPESVRQLAPHLSDGFCRIVEDMMVKSPAGRIGSAGEVVERLRPWLHESPPGSIVLEPAVSIAVSRPRGPGRPPPVPNVSSSGLREASSVSSSGAAEASFEAGVARFREVLARIGIVRLTRILTQSLVVAAVLGSGFGWAMGLVRKADPDTFTALLRGAPPMLLGWGAFVIVFALLSAAGIAATAPRRGRGLRDGEEVVFTGENAGSR